MCFELSLAEDGTFANVGQVPPRRASEGALCGKALSGKASFRRPVLHVFMDNIIHMADVSAQTMPPHLARKWGDCVTQEFAEQASETGARKSLPKTPTHARAKRERTKKRFPNLRTPKVDDEVEKKRNDTLAAARLSSSAPSIRRRRISRAKVVRSSPILPTLQKAQE